MANTAEGLTVGGEEGVDPNTAEGFAQIMEGRGVAKVEGDEGSVDRSIASGLTVAGPEPGRDPATGRFVSNQEARQTPAADTPQATATDTSGAVSEGDFADPAVQEFLKKYDGNVEEALKGAANAQALIGRRDERTEALERELAETRGRLDGLIAAGGVRPAQAPLSDEQVADVAATRIEALGFEGAATEAANVAHTTGDDRALRVILDQWGLESQYAAVNFLTDFRLWQRSQAAAQETPPEEPAWMRTVAEQTAINSIEQVIVAVAAERGVANDSPIIAQMEAALEEMPKNVLEMVGSDDPEAAAAGVRLVMDRATIMAGVAAAAAATPTTTTQQEPPSVARKLAGAAVASGALRPAPAAPKSPQTLEEAKAEFKRQIVEAPTTSIASGLTYGPQP